MHQITTFVLDHSEFDTLVNEHLKPASGAFESVAYFEWNRDTEHLVQDLHLSRFDGDVLGYSAEERDETAEWLADPEPDPWAIGPQHLLGELLYREVLQPGNYLIES